MLGTTTCTGIDSLKGIVDCGFPCCGIPETNWALAGGIAHDGAKPGGQFMKLSKSGLLGIGAGVGVLALFFLAGFLKKSGSKHSGPYLSEVVDPAWAW